jgi:hypothetical protein
MNLHNEWGFAVQKPQFVSPSWLSDAHHMVSRKVAHLQRSLRHDLHISLQIP